MNGQGDLSTSDTSPLPWSPSGGAHGSAGVASRPAPVATSTPQAIEGAFDLPDGYALQLADHGNGLAALLELLVCEGVPRHFTRVAITIDHEEKHFWVRISGYPEVKAFLRDRVLRDNSRNSEGGRS